MPRRATTRFRAKVVKLAGQPTFSRGNRRRDQPWEKIDERMADMASGAARVNHSKYWGVRLHEPKEQYGPVSVYGPDGSLVRVIPREALNRPFPRDTRKNAWNNPMFTPRA